MRALAPYAAAAVLIVTGTVAALSGAVRDALTVGGRDQPSATPSATAGRALPEMSRTARLAYWRGDPSGGEGQLFVSNLDGALRRSIAKIDGVRRTSLVRWLPDGSGVSYVEGGNQAIVARLDGTRLEIQPNVGTQGLRITDLRWSPDSRSVAATMQRLGNNDSRGDVYLARIDAPRWTRATELGDAYAADWVAADQLLAFTSGGVIAALKAGSPLRALTGVSATSPVLGPDGRVHFLAGRIAPGPRDPSVPFPVANSSAVWSMTLDGAGLRRETGVDQDDLRLDAALGNGRYLVHRGAGPLQSVLAGDVIALPPVDAGPIERAVGSPDGKSLIGFSSTRVIRFDLGATQAAGAFALNPTVLIDSATNGDVWYPRSTTIAPTAIASGPRPAARYAFWLGGNVWSMAADGTAALLRPGPTSARVVGRNQPPAPVWSPRGDRVLFVDDNTRALVPNVTSATLVPYTLDRDGRATAYPEGRAAGSSAPSWSPEGDAFAIAVDKRGVDAQNGQADLEIRFFGVRGDVIRRAVPGREVAWTKTGIFVLGENGIDLIRGDERRSLVTKAALMADPRSAGSSGATGTLTGLGAAVDGSHASVRLLSTPAGGGSRAIQTVIVRASDGAPATYIGEIGGEQALWSPVRAQFGMTTTSPGKQTAQLVDAITGKVIATRDGRFAGWSPDGNWFYAALNTGLFAYAIGGGDGVRIGPIGVPISATLP
ncbi:MAG: hypothetical protein HY071_00435 [Chloroflexi bacterium]|nr:hypothetical protein [Chloroflexota bacterium]